MNELYDQKLERSPRAGFEIEELHDILFSGRPAQPRYLAPPQQRAAQPSTTTTTNRVGQPSRPVAVAEPSRRPSPRTTTAIQQPLRAYDARDAGQSSDDDSVGVDGWPSIGAAPSARRGTSRHSSHSAGVSPVNILLGILAAVLIAAFVGLVIYVVVINIHSDGSTDDSAEPAAFASAQAVGPLQALHPTSTAVVHPAQNPGPADAASSPAGSLSYAFFLGSELHRLERHPATGSLLDIPYENLRFYTVCCSVKQKNFVCLGGVSYSRPGLFFEASLERDPGNGDTYLALWVNGEDLLGAGCYAHISYLPP